MTDDLSKIAAKLTKAQRRAIMLLKPTYQAGPTLPDVVIDELRSLRELGLVERLFADKDEMTASAFAGSVRIHVSACWYFRLDPFGAALKAYLEQETEHDV